MKRHLRQLEHILNQQLDALHCLARVQQKGPILEVLVRHIPGETLNSQQLAEIVHAALDAAFAPDIRKVNLYAQPLRDRDGEPNWLASFSYEGIDDDEFSNRRELLRQDFITFRIILIALGILAVGLYVFDPTPINLIPSILALGLAFGFTPLKRELDRSGRLFAQKVLLLGGSILLGMSVVFLVQTFTDTLSLVAIALLLGLSAVRLGWRS
ncbi:hypothetical protein [Synechococcus sp. PCC 7336]|uniref:hypothetical protein n=1 Tax=Synechococcus sp. PCC 7336 TaxID=195250 RepID=UPI00034544A8|nr:hypothetical protein [Synechococcus sp. PCC 7336]